MNLGWGGWAGWDIDGIIDIMNVKSFLVFLFGDNSACCVSLDSLWGSSDSSFGSRSNLDDSGVNGAGNTVLHFNIELGDDIGVESSLFFEILLGGSIHNVLNIESLHGFVLRASSSAVGAHDALDVSSVVLISALISSLLWH